MDNSQDFLAVDLGAESGRVMSAQFDGNQLQLSEIHRFSNRPVWLSGALHWDVLRLWAEIKVGISAAAARHGKQYAGLGLDSWGVDFGLLDRDGSLVGNPHHYRDARTDGMMEEACRRVPREEIFRQTGIQFMQLNSLYQLLSMVVNRSPALEIAHTFLTIPDLFNYWLTGLKVCEFTNATTTQCYDPRQGDWSKSLLSNMGIPTHLFPEIVAPGTPLGELSSAVAEEVGIAGLTVIAPACHDTGSAVAAVAPMAGGAAGSGDVAWISSGTWSIMGVSVDQPVINELTLGGNLTNEGGAARTRDGAQTFRLSKNIMGLWLVQECRRRWAHGGESDSYEELSEMAAVAPPLAAIIDPDDDLFLKPGDMPARIVDYCRRTGQKVPESKGALIRCALESVALKYRWVLDRLEAILGRSLDSIHIIGGGTQNRLLNQLTADATNRPVIAGPIEATAIGNVLMQMTALGSIASPAEGQEIVSRSFPLTSYDPAGGEGWDEAYALLLRLMKSGGE